MQKLHEDKQSSEHGVLAEKCCDVIDVLISTKPSRALLYIARLEDEGRKSGFGNKSELVYRLGKGIDSRYILVVTGVCGTLCGSNLSVSKVQ